MATGVPPVRHNGPKPAVRGSRFVVAAVIVAIAAPFVVVCVQLLTSNPLAAGDLGLLELRVRDVGGLHTPLVGVYSRFGWSHPGPLLFYVLAVPYRVLGTDGRALLFSGMLLNIAGVGLVGWLAWRRGRTPGLVLTAVVGLILARALGGGFLVSPWNPDATLVPLFALGLIVWSVLCRDHALLPLAFGVASFVIQSHVGTSGVSVALLGVAVASVIVDARRGLVVRPVRLLLVSVGVAVLLWLPPIIDAVRARGGNLRTLWAFWSGSHADVVGWARAGRIVSSQLTVPAPWLSGHDVSSPIVARGLDPPQHIPWVLLAMIGCAVFAARRRDRSSLALLTVAMVFTAAAWVSMARVVGEPLPYLARWIWLVGALAWLSIGWTLFRAAASRIGPRARLPAVTLACLVLVVLSVTAVAASVDLEAPFRNTERTVQRMDRELVREVRRLPGPVVVLTDDSFYGGLTADTVVNLLVAAGISAGYESGLGWRVGSSHVVAPAEARTRLRLFVGPTVASALEDPDLRLLVHADPLNRRERAEVERVEAEFPRKTMEDLITFQRWYSVDPERARRYTQLIGRGDPIAVFVDQGHADGEAR